MKRKNVYVYLLFVIITMLTIFTSFNKICFAYNSTNTQVIELMHKAEQLSKEKIELSDELAVQADINKLMLNKENNIIASTDNVINRVNFLTLLSIIIGIIVVLSTVGIFILQNFKFNLLKKEIVTSKAEFETIKTEARDVAEYTATTQVSYIQKDYETIVKELEGVKTSFQSLADDRINELANNSTKIKNELDAIIDRVNELVKKAKESENKAKESENKVKSSEYYNKAGNSDNLYEKIVLYTKAIEYDDKHDAAYYDRGAAYFKINEYYKASDDIETALKLKPVADKYNLSDIYNNRADLNRRIGKFDLALEYVKKAIEINDKNGYAYSTLAELCALKNDDVGFYKNAELGLENDCPLWEFAEADSLYDKYINTQKFMELIDRYKSKKTKEARR